MPAAQDPTPGNHLDPHASSAVFSAFALWASRQCGRATTFMVACVAILLWAVSGPFFGYTDTWQLVINTGTTIITFLIVFLIQNTQNRDMATLHLKLDALIRVSEDARNKLLNLEGMTEQELEPLQANFIRLGQGRGPGVADAVTDLNRAAQSTDAAKAKIAS